jgi:membrane fusion protein (multidrug efflux system)
MKKKNKKYTAIAAISSLIFLVAVFGFLHWKHQGGEITEIEFATATPWRENLNLKKEYVAQIRAVQHIELRSMERGYLQNIYVDEGQIVRKGQKMFQIMPMLIEAELKKAQAEYQITKIEYDNTLMLHRQKIVSANELALTKARLDKSHAEMELVEKHLQLTLVKAPFDGIMDRFQVRLGSLIEEGQLLTTISDNSKMWLYFNVSEADYLDYMQKKTARDAKGDGKGDAKGDAKEDEVAVELVLANGTLFSQTGKVDTIEADFNNEIGNVAFRATFPNPDRLLRHGETGTVLLTKKYDNALVIPQKATYEILDKKFVYVVDENNTVHSQQITVLAEVPHLFIVSGVSESDKILLEGLGKVHNGDVIKTALQNHETVLKSLMLTTK